MNYEQMVLGRIPHHVIPKWRSDAENNNYTDEQFRAFLDDLIEEFKQDDISRFRPLELELEKARKNGNKIEARQIENALMMEYFSFQRETPDIMVIFSKIRKQLAKHSMSNLFKDFTKIFVESANPPVSSTPDMPVQEPGLSPTMNDLPTPVQTFSTANSGTSSPVAVATARQNKLGSENTFKIVLNNYDGKASAEDICKISGKISGTENINLTELWCDGDLPVMTIEDDIKYYCTLERSVKDLLEKNRDMTIEDIQSTLIPFTYSKDIDIDLLRKIVDDVKRDQSQ